MTPPKRVKRAHGTEAPRAWAGEPAEEDFAIQLGRMLGLVVAAFVLLVGGGIGLILLAALFLRFMYGG